MKISDMEALLQQEMEAVKGGSGIVKVCRCETGALVTDPLGSCECETAAQAHPAGICSCDSGAQLSSSLITPPGGLDCLIGLSR